jgi:hypothetical protein
MEEYHQKEVTMSHQSSLNGIFRAKTGVNAKMTIKELQLKGMFTAA